MNGRLLGMPLLLVVVSCTAPRSGPTAHRAQAAVPAPWMPAAAAVAAAAAAVAAAAGIGGEQLLVE